MGREFIPYAEALALKELGFDKEICFGRWTTYPDGEGYLDTAKHSVYQGRDDLNRQCLAPLYQQAFRWFREKYDLHGITFKNKKNKLYNEDIKTHSYTIIGNYNNVLYNILSNEYKLSFEETELKCLKKLIELCKNN